MLTLTLFILTQRQVTGQCGTQHQGRIDIFTTLIPIVAGKPTDS
ncbi:hypothetical protein [Parvibium lacunae]|nr:hypothetical protein [Parvibium lacunae]